MYAFCYKNDFYNLFEAADRSIVVEDARVRGVLLCFLEKDSADSFYTDFLANVRNRKLPGLSDEDYAILEAVEVVDVETDSYYSAKVMLEKLKCEVV